MMNGGGTARQFARGDDGYEEARRATVWNARTPPRHPDLIVHAQSAEDEGLVLRSRFWLGAVLRPDLSGVFGSAGARMINRPPVRRRALPKGPPQALARHCAEEYTHLAALLPELHGRWGGASA